MAYWGKKNLWSFLERRFVSRKNTRPSDLSEEEIRAGDADAIALCSFRTEDLLGDSPQEEEDGENLRSNEIRKAELGASPC